MFPTEQPFWAKHRHLWHYNRDNFSYIESTIYIWRGKTFGAILFSNEAAAIHGALHGFECSELKLVCLPYTWSHCHSGPEGTSSSSASTYIRFIFYACKEYVLWHAARTLRAVIASRDCYPPFCIGSGSILVSVRDTGLARISATSATTVMTLDLNFN